ncbi:hypothetical protein LW278_003528 [Salmonella enterica]|nr:hypothetical protein [Salmonella enterica]
MKKTHLLSVLALGISAACHAETYPAPIGPSQSDFGGVGLLQTPTARMYEEVTYLILKEPKGGNDRKKWNLA